MLSTSRAPPFTEKWFWFKADPRRTGAYAYASERVHSISFICRIIAVFLFAAQGRANARVHRLKVSLEFVPHSAEVVQLLSDPRLCSSFLFQFSSFVESEICAQKRIPFLWNGIKGGREGSAYLSFSPSKKNLLKPEKSIERKERFFFLGFFIRFIAYRKLESFFSFGLYLIIFGSRNFLIFLLSCYYYYYYSFLSSR